MRILHLSTFDRHFGAAISAYRLHEGLRRGGHESRMLVRCRCTTDSAVALFQPRAGLWPRLRRRLRWTAIVRDFARAARNRPAGYEEFTDDRSAFACDFPASLPQADIVQLHWVAHQYLDYGAFLATVPTVAPVVWTLHDMNPLTGGCHYSLGCERFLEGCGRCPQLGSADARDLSRAVWRRKQAAFGEVDAGRLHFVAPSRWLAELAGRGPLLARFPVHHIPYGLDTAEFAPRDHGCARAVMELPAEARIVLFVADSTANRRKGFDLLVQALEGLKDVPNLFLASVGRDTPQLRSELPHRHLGHITNGRWLSLAYSAADLFVLPSREDNLPNTVLEALACGVPVVGFAVGGVPEMVRPGETGLLAAPGDVGALREAIRSLLRDDAARRAMGENARRIAVAEYDLDLQAQRYVALYEEMVKEGMKAET